MANTDAIILFSKPASITERSDGESLRGLQQSDLDALSTAMFDDVVERVLHLGGTDVIVYGDGKGFSDDFIAQFMKRVTCRATQGNCFAEQLRYALEDAVAEHYARFLVLMEIQPALSMDFFRHVFDLLTYEDDCVVVGPTFEETWYLLGLKTDHNSVIGSLMEDELLEPASMFARLCSSDTIVFPTHSRYSLNSLANLDRLKNELEILQDMDSDSPRRTIAMLKKLDKKRKPKREP